MRLNGHNVMVLLAMAEKPPYHIAAMLGALTLPKLKDYLKQKDGFLVSY